MNTLFADEVTTTKNDITGSLPPDPAVARVNALDWQQVGKNLDEQGSALLQSVLSPDECQALAALYPTETIFRSHVVMGRHGFGRGEYKYFNYPLPDLIQGLRTALYSRLVPVANRWNAAMGIEVCYPDNHEEFVRRCHDAGQLRPTPLLLQYAEGDYNCLHQDLYGEHVFPIQVAILLSEPQRASFQLVEASVLRRGR
jgi:uncharacterized protein